MRLVDMSGGEPDAPDAAKGVIGWIAANEQ